MPTDDSFGGFLRSRREHTRPADVGLPERGRRRTPGLRREELATLAGVSIDYLIRLEQGRDTNPSPEVLASLAQALHLDEDERVHLFKLSAHEGTTKALCPRADEGEHQVAPTVRTLLERLGSTPAFVVGPYNDVLAWNDAFELVARPMGLLDGDPPNLVRFAVLDERAPTTYPDWEQAVDEQVAQLRVASRRWDDDDRYHALLDALRGVPVFEASWAKQDVAQKRRGTKRLVHPEAGELRVAYEALYVPDAFDQRLITWLDADEHTASALHDLVHGAGPPQLRVVGER